MLHHLVDEVPPSVPPPRDLPVWVVRQEKPELPHLELTTARQRVVVGPVLPLWVRTELVPLQADQQLLYRRREATLPYEELLDCVEAQPP